MIQNDEFDEIDNLMFDYFSKNNDIPESTKKVVYNAFNNHNKKIINNLKKVSIYIISIAIVTSSVAIADGLINSKDNLFVNTTDAIDAAIENGYIQSVDMDYVYDNNIGVKINNLVLDDNTADITFEYKCDKDYSNVILDEYVLKTNNCENTEELSDYFKINGFRRYKDSKKLGEGIFNESILYDLDNKYKNFNKIFFEIKSIIVKDGEVYKTINGNWNFEINLCEKMLNRKNEIYKATENALINNISAQLSELTFIVDITINQNIDTNIVSGKKGVILKDKSGKEYRYRNISTGNDDQNKGKIYVEYDISRFQENLEEFELYLKISDDKEIKLNLEKIKQNFLKEVLLVTVYINFYKVPH